MRRGRNPYWLLIIPLVFITVSCSSVDRELSDQPFAQNKREAADTPRLAGVYPSICAEDVAVLNNYVYLADGIGGISIIDAGNPANPMLVRTISTTYAFRIYINDAHLYLCDGPAGVKVYSLSNPPEPVLTKSVDTNWASGLAFVDDYLYLADYDAGVKIFDITDPSQPSLVASKDLGWARDVAVEGDMLAISNQAFGLAAFTLTSPVDTLWKFTDTSTQLNSEDIITYNGYAIVGRNDDRTTLLVYDLSDPENIAIVDEINPALFAPGLTSSNEVLFVACGEKGVMAYEMSDPSNLQFLWYLDTPSYARRARVSGNYLYVADMTGLAILDIDGLGGEW
jgi:hypothetical protein